MFERSLYGPETFNNDSEIVDVDFWAERMIAYPSFRPLYLDKAVTICVDYCLNQEFRRVLLGHIFICPVLIYRLFKRGIYSFNEIEPYLNREDSFILCCYYRKMLNCFEDFVLNKKTPRGFDDSVLDNDNEVDLLIEYGFLPNTVEFCLKYDDIEVFRDLIINKMTIINWNPFEWSKKPEYQDLLSFSGFFGSIKCFKYLVLNGYHINKQVCSMVLCSGNQDLLHICNTETTYLSDYAHFASKFCHLSLLGFFVENDKSILKRNDQITKQAVSFGHISIVEYIDNQGIDVNSIVSNNESSYFPKLLFTKQLLITIYW